MQDYDRFIEYSLLDFGNNARIKSFMKKVSGGEQVTMVFLGGSITERYNGGVDGCYGKVFTEMFGEKYTTSDKVEFKNAGMAGTDSVMGLIRVERDVLRYSPDIVFVEFAVNDSKDALHREAYESLLTRLLQSEKKPAVVLIFVRAQEGYNCQGQMQAAGEHYQLPMLSISDAIVHMTEEGRMLWSDYGDDYIHPHREGNRMIAGCLMHYFHQADLMPADAEVPVPNEVLYGRTYYNMQLMDETNARLVKAGGFLPDNSVYQFPKGWCHRRDSGKESFELRITAGHLFLIYRESNDTNAGCAEVYVDGVRQCTLDSYKVTGWNNPALRHILSKERSEEHRIEIKMIPGDEHKEFAVVAFGYCDYYLPS